MKGKACASVHSTQELADYLGLSRWTVSRAINGHASVNSKTRERVDQAIRELGFSRNPFALGLRGARTGIIGVCFQEFETPMLARKTWVLQKILHSFGYQVLIELANVDALQEQQVLQNFMVFKVDGIVLAGSLSRKGSSIIKKLSESRMPVVAIDPRFALPFQEVSSDRSGLMQTVFEHLYEQGHRSFVTFGIDERVAYGAVRIKGIRAFAKDRRLEIGKDIHIFETRKSVHLDQQYGYDQANEFMALKPRPTAIVTMNDQIAQGAIKHLYDVGIKIPRDVSIVGFDDLKEARFCIPALTTCTPKEEVLMQAVVERLVDQIEKKSSRPLSKKLLNENSRTLIQPELVIRQSTSAPRSIQS